MSQLVKFNTFPAFRTMLDNLWGNEMMGDDFIRGSKMPAVNIKENEKAYEVEMAAPGMKKENFNIAVENGILTISANVQDEKEEKEKDYTRREFSYNSFSRSFTLPQNIDENSIKAKYDNGVLYLTINKLQEEKAHKKTIPLS